MSQSNVVRRVARDMVMTYVQYLDKVTQENNKTYLQLGVDEDFSIYRNLFTVVIGRVLRVSTDVKQHFPLQVQMELEELLRNALAKTGQSRYIENRLFAEYVYKVCMHVMNRVQEDKFAAIEEMRGW